MTLVSILGAPLLYLATAVLVLWLSGRFVRPLSRLVAWILLLLPLLFTGRALLTGGIYAPIDLPFGRQPLTALAAEQGIEGFHSPIHADLAYMIIPYHEAVRHALRAGSWPLWNPFVLCGSVLAAAGQPAAYHPLHLLGLLLPLGPSLTFRAAVLFFLAALGAFLLARELRCRESTALVAALGWMGSSFLVFTVGWPLGLSTGLAPWVFLAARRVARAPGWRAAGLLLTALVMVLLAGHPETVLHTVSVAALYGLAELWAAGKGRRAVAVGAAVAAGGLALALVAVDLLPFMEAAPQTVGHRLRQLHGAGRSLPWDEAAAQLRVAAVPFVYGVPWDETVRGPRYFVPMVSVYIGSALLAPALFGLWRSRWWGRWFLLGMVVLGVLAAISTPGVTELLNLLPLFRIAINRYLVSLAALALALLAALGAEAWVRRPDRRLGWLGLGVVVVLAALIASFWPDMRASGLSADFLRLHTWFALLPSALATVLLLGSTQVRLVLGGLLIIVAGQRVAEVGAAYPTLPAAAFYPPVEVLDRLPRDEAPYRIVGHGPTLQPNLSTLYGLEDVRGYEPMLHRRFYNTYRLWSERPFGAAHNQVRQWQTPFLSFLNVRYALVSSTAPPPPGWTRMATGQGIDIYENPRLLPRAFVPERVRINERPKRMWEAMARLENFEHLAWVEVPHPAGTWPTSRHKNGPGFVSLRAQGPGRYEIAAEMVQPGWVVVSETAWKGWRARSAGRVLPIHFANHAFLAFHLPAGRHEVELAYRPRSFLIGRAISLLTLAGIVLTILFRALRPHRADLAEVRGGVFHALEIRRIGGRRAA